MGRLRWEIVLRLCRAILAGARRGILPKGLAFSFLGLALSPARADEPCYVMCYESVSPYGPRVTRVLVTHSLFLGPTAMITVTLKSNNPIGGARIRASIPDGSGKFTDIVIPMKSRDGKFDSESEEAYARIALWGWPDWTLFSVMGYDEKGQEGLGLPLGARVESGHLVFDCKDIRTEGEK